MDFQTVEAATEKRYPAVMILLFGAAAAAVAKSFTIDGRCIPQTCGRMAPAKRPHVGIRTYRASPAFEATTAGGIWPAVSFDTSFNRVPSGRPLPVHYATRSQDRSPCSAAPVSVGRLFTNRERLRRDMLLPVDSSSSFCSFNAVGELPAGGVAPLAPMADVFPCGLLEALVVVGASEDSLSQCLRAQAAAGGNSALRQHPEPVILNILAPPFVAKEAAAPRLATAPPLQRSAGFTRSQKRRSFRKPKSSRLSMSGGGPEAGGLGGGGGASHTQPVSVPRELDFNGLPSLCFPEGLRVQSEEEEASFHYLVFTDMSGKRTHGVVLTHSRRLQDTGPLPWASNGSLRQPGQRRLGRPGKSPYLPYAICVISKSPYYTVLRDCLSCLLMELQSTKDSLFEDRIADFAATLALVPCPPPGVLHVSLMLRPLQMILTRPPSRGNQRSTLTSVFPSCVSVPARCCRS
ncbi:unnamed protein product [Lampetra fluviatilis]